MLSSGSRRFKSAFMLMVFSLVILLIYGCEKEDTIGPDDLFCNQNFEGPIECHISDISYSVEVVDVSEDTIPDMIFTNFASGDVSIVLGCDTISYLNTIIIDTVLIYDTPYIDTIIIDTLLNDSIYFKKYINTIVIDTVINDSVHFSNTIVIDTFLNDITNYDVGSGPWGMYAGDLNDDSLIDLAVANDLSGTISILINSGGGVFEDAVDYPAGVRPRSIQGADFDDDGDIDLALGNCSPDGVYIYKNDGNGVFSFDAGYSAGLKLNHQNENIGPYSITKLNNDVNFDNYIRPNKVFEVGDVTWSICLADLNDDDYCDIVAIDFERDLAFVLINDGTGSFGNTANAYAVGAAPRFIVALNINGDTYPDLVTANYDSDNISVLLNNGNGTFGTANNYSVTKPTALYPVDINGDGYDDIAVASSRTNSVTIYIGKGTGSFTDEKCTFEDVGREPIGIFGIDVDDDDDNDLVISNYSSYISSFENISTISILTNAR